MIAGGSLVAGVSGLLLTGVAVDSARPVPVATTPLRSATAAFASRTRRVLLAPGDAGALLPGSRILRDADDAPALAAAERAWLDEGSSWLARAGEHSDLARNALLDLRTLLLPGGAAVAGWSTPWRYVWPRDAAFTAAAFSATGHPAEAAQIMGFLQRNRPSSGWFEARYRPDGGGSPDKRAKQLDGFGWVLWGAARMAADSARAGRDPGEVLAPVRALLDACAEGCLDAIDNRRALPSPSPDYWEKREWTRTLGIAAPLLSGLRAAERIYAVLGASATRDRVRDGAARLQESITHDFGRDGYPRSLGRRDKDASLAFLLPPFADAARPDVVAAFDAAAVAMARPAGGIAPGESWPRDGVSWTPQTALFGLAAAGLGRADEARRTLRWLGAHATAAGSLPEKVLADGKPADVAPLAWTASTALLTLDLLRP